MFAKDPAKESRRAERAAEQAARSAERSDEKQRRLEELADVITERVELIGPRHALERHLRTDVDDLDPRLLLLAILGEVRGLRRDLGARD